VEIGWITVVWIEIDTEVIQKMALEETKKGNSGQRDVRFGGYRVIRP
jgi:hypothetical protein